MPARQRDPRRKVRVCSSAWRSYESVLEAGMATRLTKESIQKVKDRINLGGQFGHAGKHVFWLVFIDEHRFSLLFFKIAGFHKTPDPFPECSNPSSGQQLTHTA